MASAVTWFEIPCSDFERGRRFYETVLGVALVDTAAPGMKMASFPADWQKDEIGGALVAGQNLKPSVDGTTVYLRGDPDLQVVLDRVEAAGGGIVMPKTKIPMEGGGYFAQFIDSEGNRVGVTSMG